MCKRFKCHQMIADYTTGEDIDFDFLQELINEQEQPLDLKMHISEGNKILTYRECVDMLNNFEKENIILRNENDMLKKQIEYIQNSIDNAIRHSKTEIEQKILKKIIEDYNEYMLGYKELLE